MTGSGPARPDAPAPFGRPSAAAGAEAKLRPDGDAASAGYRAEGASTSWCTLRAASVVGVRHRLAGQCSDDSFAWAWTDDQLAVAVADGVGSLAGSSAAAARACRVAVASACRTALASVCRTPVEAGAGGGEAEAAIEAANAVLAGEGATTLVVAILRSDGNLELARVGDSSAWLCQPDQPGRELFPPPDPDRSGTATAALPAPAPETQTVSGRLLPGQILCLVTDGVADPWRDGPTTAAPALDSGLAARPGPIELLALTDFSRQGCHDDRTLLAVWLSGPEP